MSNTIIHINLSGLVSKCSLYHACYIYLNSQYSPFSIHQGCETPLNKGRD